MAVLVVHTLLAPAALALLAGALITNRVSRWRPLWLAVLAAAGAVATAATGLAPALSGFTAGPRRVLTFLSGLPGHPARLAHLPALLAGAGPELPRQLPLALLAAAGEAALLTRLGWPGGRPRPGDCPWPGGPGRYRAGLIVLVRGRLTRAALAAGEVVTVAGGGLGVDVSSGRPAEITWPQAERGVLLTAGDGAAAARAGFPLACAAVRRRKSVIVIDLSGSSWLADALTAACAAAGAPLARFGVAGPGCYEPFRSYPPARAADLAAQLVDWAGGTDQQRQAGQHCLAAAFAVVAAAPPAGPVLDGLLALLEPGALAAAAARLPGRLPPGAQVARHPARPAGPPAADPDAAALRGQLHQLRASALGGWLRPAAPAGATAAGEVAVRLPQAVQDRGCVLFSLGPAPDAAAAARIGRLALADLSAVLGDLSVRGLRGDCLAWVHGCEAADQMALARLMAAGPATGTGVLLSTGGAATAAQLAGAVGVVVSIGPADQRLAERLAETAPLRQESSRRVLAELLRWQDEDHFAVLASGQQPRCQPECRLVPGPWARPR